MSYNKQRIISNHEQNETMLDCLKQRAVSEYMVSNNFAGIAVLFETWNLPGSHCLKQGKTYDRGKQ